MRNIAKYNANKNEVLGLCVAIILFFFPFFSSISVYAEQVTNRELLMLAIMSYKNDQKVNTWENTKDEKFNAKWFGGYADASELRGWQMVDSVINPSLKVMKGFSAVTYKKDDNVVVAFRGTDSGIINENWEYAVPQNEHPQIKFLNEYIDHLKEAPFFGDDSKIYIVGHSLGGYLATYCLGKMLQIENFKNKIVKAVTFNGLGLGYIKDKSIKEALFSMNPGTLVNYSIKGDVVSLLGQHFTKLIYLKNLRPKVSSSRCTLPNNPHFTYNFLVQSPFLAAE